MNYKKLFKTRRSRVLVLKALSFIPDKPMLKLQYRIKMDQKLNLKNPVLFTEKMQWYKLNYRDEVMKTCVDKGKVRDYISEKGLSDILIPVIGVYNKVEEIPFESLPDQIMIKDTLGMGGGSVISVDTIQNTDIERIKTRLDGWVKSDTSYKVDGREWFYGGHKHRIIIEKKLSCNETAAGLLDYKIHCFGGTPKFIQCIGGRNLAEHTGYQNNYDFEWNKLDWTFADYPDFPYEIPKPEKLKEMYSIAEELSKDFPYVRVDLYQVDGYVYFGELTFNAGSGYYPYKDRWTKVRDKELGDMFPLVEKHESSLNS